MILRTLLIAACGMVLTSRAIAARPNIIVILVDDMGFSDLGCYGSEIPTPNIDRLAAGGAKFTQFYNTARCCPTRAALLTGVYSHQAGVGHMVEDKGEAFRGYRGKLQDRCVTIAEVLRPAGYFTAMTGKWHLGQNQGLGPWQRGFQRGLNSIHGGFYFDHMDGADKTALFLDGRALDVKGPELPQPWYSTDLWTEFGLRFIDEALAAKQPFFLYLAHNAPHFPLQAPPEDIANFRGKYKAGWDVLAKARHEKQLALGVVSRDWPAAPRPESVAAWDSLTEADRDHFDQLMAIYAAVVSRMDRAIGTLTDGLQKRGVLENTLILFMSDNGGNAEGGVRGTKKGSGAPGSADSTVFSGESWAWMQNTPFRKFKHYNHEGGIATPLIAHWPAGIAARGEWRHEPAHLIDIMATCVAAGGAPYPKEHNGHAVLPMEGVSLLPAFAGQPTGRLSPIFWEHEGNAAVRDGDWKLVRLGAGGQWELYNLKTDRTEQKNLAAAQPDKVGDLTAKWQAWAARAFVEPRPGAGKRKRSTAAATLKLKPDTDLRDDAAPDIAGRAFTVRVILDKPGTRGVLAAQGGAHLGWSLFFEGGKLHFLINREGQRSEVAIDDASLAAATELTAALSPEGVARLFAGDREVAKQQLPGILPSQPKDGLQTGRDLGGPVGDYEVPFPFDGIIQAATLEIKAAQ